MNRVVIIHKNSEITNQLEMKINCISNYMCTAIFENPISILTENIFCDFIVCSVGFDDLSILEKIMTKLPNVNIIILTEKLDTNIIFKALQIGVIGLVNTINYQLNFKEVFSAIDDDGAYMTPKIARKVINYFNSGNKVKVKPHQQRIRYSC